MSLRGGKIRNTQKASTYVHAVNWNRTHDHSVPVTAQYNVDRNAIVIGRLNVTCIVGKGCEDVWWIEQGPSQVP